MEPVVLFWMVKDGERKPVMREGVREELEALGWVREEEAPRRGRKPKDLEE